MSNIREYVPSIYNEVSEMDYLINADDKLLDLEESFLDRLENSQFIITAPVDIISEYEKLLNIIPKNTDTLEFRRDRIINRISMTPPFSLPYLRQKLNTIIGTGKYECYMNYDSYTLYIESSAENQTWAEEIYITINKLKPANIVFINKPLIVYNNNVNEEIELTKRVYNYKLGTTWVLGRKSFSSIVSGGVIKLASAKSIQNEFLNDIALFSANNINNVLINDTEVISEFTTKTSENNIATIEYTIPTSLGITEVTNIKLRDSDNNILTSSTVYVPILEDVIIKHKINIKEGV